MFWTNNIKQIIYYILTLLLHVPTDENDNVEIDTNEEIPEGFVVGDGDELTNLENDLDIPGNFKL